MLIRKKKKSVLHTLLFQDVVQYLIEQGARCEANTFDGERCLYAALTPDIKQILKEANLINSKTMRRDSFEEFLRQMMESSSSSLADVRFNVHGESVSAHKCLLFARSEFFADKLFHKWRGKSEVRLNNARLFPPAFKAFIHYLYTGSMDVSVGDQEDYIRLLKQVGAEEMVDQIRERVKKAESYKKLKPGKNFGQFVTVALPDTGQRLSSDFGKLADSAMPRQEQDEKVAKQGRWTDDDELPFMEERPPHAPFADVCFFVEGKTFFCHKVFFCGRSDFFRALIDDHFQESDAIVKSPVDDSMPGVRIPRKSLNSWSEELGVSPTPASWHGVAISPTLFGNDSVAAYPTPPSSVGDKFEDNLKIGSEITLLPLIRLHSISQNVFMRIVRYVYTNVCELDADCVYEVKWR